MNRTRRVIGAACLAVVALLGASAVTSEPARQHLHTTITQPFNEGFADSKQDDCEQGFQPACDWLAHNH
jgi:hypothetical protein